MVGQMLGGGVIALLIVALWLVYFVPAWHSAQRFRAAERNAVRLGQTLRILAETSDTPEEVRVELGTRVQFATQRLAKKTLAEREAAEIQKAKRELEEAREQARRERAAALALPAARRRRARMLASVVLLLAIVIAAVGVWQLTTTASWGLLVVAGVVGALGLAVLQRMARVAAHSRAREGGAVASRPADAVVADVAIESAAAPASARWQPRPLPRPLTASSGSRAATVLAAQDAHEALRRAAIEEAKRERAEQLAPPQLPVQPAAVAESAAEPSVAGVSAASSRGADSVYGRMGYVDDAEIEAHVRTLLARRAAG